MNQYFYEVYIVGLSSPALTYVSSQPCCNGDIVEIEFHHKPKQAVIKKEVAQPSYKCKDIKKTDLFYPSPYIKLFDFISTYYCCNFGKAIAIAQPFVQCQTSNFKITKDVELTSHQKKVYEFTQNHQTSLIFGNTGSGKTEIYIKAILQALKNNKNAILLMPEISLTPQMNTRLLQYFGERMCIWHSKLTKKKRTQILQDIHNGDINLVVGTRSALFLPLHDVGLIIIDEEHDDSYKSHTSPRYNAKDIAIYMSQLFDIKLILGSATPSLSSFAKIPYIRLTQSFFKGSKEFEYINNDSPIERIKQELRVITTNQKQAIIFTPTRGNFKYIICKECDYKMKCPYCDVGMSLHSFRHVMKCHYCNFAQPIPSICPECESQEFMSFRMGTAEIVSELEDEFDSVMKFDKDEVSTHKKLISLLKKFNDKKINILVGTQMLSKGHDYHDIDLAVILGIDYILGMPDFRARERALSLAIQVAGRAGRKSNAKVIIQTNNAEFFQTYINDYEQFLKDELENLKDFYPPFKRFLNILISHKNVYKAKEIMNQIVHILESDKSIELVGYGESGISKIASRYRFNVLLRSSSHKKLLQSVQYIKHLPCEIDMDPITI